MSVEVLQKPHSLSSLHHGTEIPAIKTCEADKEATKKDCEESQKDGQTKVARANSKRTYSKEELYTVKDSPSTKIRPDNLSDKYCNREGVWDPELWYYSEESEKRSASPTDSKKKSLLDGFVLSPQGRSFARGCQVVASEKSVKHNNWNSEKQERDARNKTSGRVGRGWDPRERSGSNRGRVSPYSDLPKFEKSTKSESRYTGPGKNCRRAGSYESQPEWFTHGPTSQTDMIELRGFDEGEKRTDNKRKKRKKEIPAEGNVKPPDDTVDDGKNFDINDFFDLAENALPISGMYDNQITSRFSQWFHDGRQSGGSLNASGSNSRRSSITDELAEIAGLTLTSPLPRSPIPDADFLFAPIATPSDPYHTNGTMTDNEVDVQPLLDSVIPHKTVKGAKILEDLEGEQETEEIMESPDNALAFTKLVETMKASGNLPEKPTPTIPDIPPHLLPRPPSSSSKDRSRTSSPNMSRSPSPLQLLQDAIRQRQSPVSFVQDPRMMPTNVTLHNSNPEMFSPVSRIVRSLTSDELYGAPPMFNMNAPGSLFEFTGYNNSAKSNLQSESMNEQRTPTSSTLSNNSGAKLNSAGYPVISQSFVPTSVLRKIHSDKHDQKSSEMKRSQKDELPSKTRDYHATQRQPQFDAPTTPPRSAGSSQSFPEHSRTNLMSPHANLMSPHANLMSPHANLMSPHEFLSPKRVESALPLELLTPHHLPLPGSPTNQTPHSLPLPRSPRMQESSHAPAMSAKQQMLTPRSLPLPHSPMVNGQTSNGTDNFGIRPLPRATHDSYRPRPRHPTPDAFKRPLDMRHNTPGNNFRGFHPGGQAQFSPGMMRRPPVQPGLVPSPYNMNAANLGRGMNVHPTALALALRNQQYQMARAAAVAAATAAVNRPSMMSSAQAAALMLNQQRANASAAALRANFMQSQVNPRMFQQSPLRPNLPPALQHHQHHVVHRSESSKEGSLSQWFSDAVLNQSQSQPSPPGRGAQVLSVEELERHA